MAIRASKKLEAVVREIAQCRRCRQNGIGRVVPGEGSAHARVAFVGEAPGREEAKTGRPFVGRAGKLLRSLIRAIGLKEADIYITNPVKRLPRYGTPKRGDILHGRTHLMKEFWAIRPKIVVLLGRVAIRAFFDAPPPVIASHGRVFAKDGRTYFITLHPSAALRFKKFRKILEGDFRKLKTLLRRNLS